MAGFGRYNLRKYATIGLAGLCLIVATAAIGQELAEELPEPEVPATNQEVLPNRTIPSEESTGNQLTSSVLTVDQDRLFAESAWGQRAAREVAEAGRKIEADNERLTKQLSDEEAELTALRETLDPAEFRKRAEAFDLRATEIRRERAAVVQELNAKTEEDRKSFFKAALPIMGDVMQRREAAVVLNRRTVFVSLEAIDITKELIAEIDTRIGAGPVPDEVSGTPKELE